MTGRFLYSCIYPDIPVFRIPLCVRPYRSGFVVPTYRSETNVTASIRALPNTGVVPLNVASNDALSGDSHSAPQPCTPSPSVVLCDLSSPQLPYDISTFTASSGVFRAPHDSALFAVASNPVLEESAIAPAALSVASSAVKHVETVSCDVFCDRNYYSLSSSSIEQQQQQQYFTLYSPVTSLASSSSSEKSLPQSIYSPSTSNISSYAPVHSQHYCIQNSSQHDISANVEQVTTECSSGFAVNEFLDGLIKESRDEIRQCQLLEKRFVSDEFDQTTAKRPCISSENHDVFVQEVYTEPVDVAKQNGCNNKDQNVDRPLLNNEKSPDSSSIISNPGSIAMTNFGSDTSVSTGSPAISELSCSCASQDNLPRRRLSSATLAALSDEEIANRKREQNRIAAARYRKKKKNNQETGRLEIERLEKRNAYLRLNVEMLTKEIYTYKQTILQGIRKGENRK